MNRPALHRFLFLATLLSFCASALSQQSLQTLHRHLRPAVSSGEASLQGALPLDQQMQLTILLPLRNADKLDTLLSQLYDPTSAKYHQFLSVDEFTAEFGPTAQDYQTVVDFAKTNKFTVTDTPANRLTVPISGSVAQVNQAFHVQMNSYRHPTEPRSFYSPDREPSLNLSVAVAHIVGMDNYSIPQPRVHPPQLGRSIASVLGSGPGSSYLGSDMRAAYYGGTTLTGAGQVVGLFEFAGYNLSDVNLTFSSAGQSNNVPIVNVLLEGATGTAGSSDSEEVLDIVQAIGMAPGLSQLRVYIAASDDADILNSMATENLAKQIGISWGWLPADPTTDDAFFKEFAAQGQSVFVASGDDGAFDTAISPFIYPADDDYITAVGGTHLITSSAGGAWVSETVWNSPYNGGTGSGGGISPDAIPIPSWQAGVATVANGGSTTLRNVPDVAMEADYDNFNCSVGVCSGGWAGTSFSAPRWAGFMALVNQQAIEAGTAPAGGVGFINPALYAIGDGANYRNDLHDITLGNNDTGNQPVWFSATTGYDLTTGWGSPTGQHLIDALAGPQLPGFWIAASAAAVGINQGGRGASTITVSDAGGFTGNVTLAVTSTLPTGVTATWATNPTAGSSLMTLSASSSAVPGQYTVTITGTSGSATATTSIGLTVNGSTFTLSDAPSVLMLFAGSSATSTIGVVPQYGFTASVGLTIAGLPSGVTAAFSPNPTTASSVLTLTASSSAPAGKTTATITGTSGRIVVNQPIVVIVRAAPATTTTTLALTSVGSPVTTVAAGSAVTMTASVNAGANALTTGRVNFCDATATYCEDIHLLGSAQLTSAGTATMKFIPGVGSHSYKAVYTGTNRDSASSSSSSSLSVTAAIPSATTIAQSGLSGNYTLTSTVTAIGPIAPSGSVSFLDTSNTNALLGTATLGNASSSLKWVSQPSPMTGTEPDGIAVGDFNGDGIPDLAVANISSNSVTILLGNGDGTFNATATTPTTGSDPVGVTVGDFNGDGKLDLAVANWGSDTVTILLGNGDGTFGAGSTLTAGVEPRSIAVGDFNGDGIPDLAVANTSSNSVTILLGNGDGTFTTAATLTTGGPYFIAAADFRGIGTLDLAVVNLYANTVSVFLGDGDGTFTPSPVSPTTGSLPYAIAVGDFNADGKPDLAVANHSRDTVTILLGNGDGTFTPTPASPTTEIEPDSIAVGDFTGTGNVDLAVVNQGTNDVTILLGNGNGTFTPTASSLTTGSVPVGIVAGDFNGDGQADLAVTNALSNNVTILTGQWTQTATATAIGISPVGQGIHLADASYAGDSVYKSSLSGTTGLTALLLPAITWTTPAAISYGTALSATQLNASSTVAGRFSYSPAAGAVLAAGSQTLKVTFTPTDTTDYTTATSTVTLTVNQATPAIAWTTPASISYGTALSATQLNASSTVAGSFSYSPAAGAVLGVGPQTLKTTLTPTDSADYTTATATVPLIVTQATPTIALLPTAASAFFSDAVSFTATISSSAAIPSGTVAFYDGTTLLATVPLSSGVATYSTSNLSASIHSITAAYSGDTNYLTVTSTPLSETIEDFTIAPASGNNSLTASAGGQAIFTLQLAPTLGSNFASAITLTVSGLPTGATATFSPPTLAANSAAGSTMLTVILPSQIIAQPMENQGTLPLALGAILLPFAVGRKRSLRALSRSNWLLLLGLSTVLISAIVGCGKSVDSVPPSYQLTVTATSGSLSHSTTINLTVQ